MKSSLYIKYFLLYIIYSYYNNTLSTLTISLQIVNQLWQGNRKAKEQIDSNSSKQGK